jgi:NAD+ kinase
MKKKSIGLLVKKTTFQYHLGRLESLGLTADKYWEQYTGTSRKNLENRHNLHMRNVARIKNKIQKHNYEVVPLKSALINKEPIDLAAAIGGDGTFIRAAGWIRGNNAIPLVGFNSDPEGSHGELCSILPSQAEDFFTRLHDNHLRYLLRTRIRTQLRGPAGSFKSMNTQVAHKVAAIPENTEMESRILEEKALNEVFVGEIDSTAPSYFEISVNGGKPQKIKCSGLLVSTGTGSTAWSQNVGMVTYSELDEINDVLRKSGNSIIRYPKQVITALRNRRSIPPEADHLLVTIREPIVNRVFDCNNTRFKVKTISITSRCYSGMVAVDGKYRYSLPAGCVARFDADIRSSLITFPKMNLQIEKDQNQELKFLPELFQSYI